MDGWIGSTRQFVYTLKTFGADEDENGDILISGEPPCSFMGMGEELVVNEKTLCRVKGKWVPAVGLMQMTSYGKKITVI